MDHYSIDGKKYPRVSDIVKFAYPNEFDKIPQHDRDFYFSRGTECHRLWEMVETGEADKYTFAAEAEKYRGGHGRFLRETGFRALPSGIELRAVNKDLGYAGRLDRLGTMQNRLILADYKTNTVNDKIVSLQTALYLLALNYKFGDVERYGIAFRDDGTYRMSVRYPNSDEDEAIYYATKFKEARK